MVYAIVVTFNPCLVVLNRCLISLKAQVDEIILIDNGSTNYIEFSSQLDFFDDYMAESLDENIGIAAAQNKGIIKALKHGAEFILLSDQDTEFPNDMVHNYLKLHEEYSKEVKIGGIAPIFFDKQSVKTQPVIKVTSLGGVSRFYGRDTIFYPSHVIASGMFIPKAALDEVGLFYEELFIDWVDTEWCWRCLSNNHSIIQTPLVVIDHELGYDNARLFGRSLTLHNDFRNFFKTRNALALCLYSKLKLRYRLHLFFHALKNVCLSIFFSKKKIKAFYNQVHAIFRGVTNSLGSK